MIRRAIPVSWQSPLAIAAGLQDQPWPVALVAGADDVSKHGGRWSFVACAPDRTATITQTDLALPALDDWAQGPVVGLVSYDAGAREACGDRPLVWPDLILAHYPAWLAFDHLHSQLWACGWGEDEAQALAHAERARSWLALAREQALPSAPSEDFVPEEDGAHYCQSVADIVRRIGEGELFQANIARAFTGRLKPQASPFDCFARLSEQRGAAYGAWWQTPDHALVSNSPELFLTYQADSRRIETRPIKGTRPRFEDSQRDVASGLELAASVKDQAENLMIVDLMRNDLGRVAEIGSVRVERLFELESHPTVHHLTSVVSAQVKAGLGWADILRASFPPGSITGAPKHQAMKVIAQLEPPRGAWCGTLFVQNMGLAEDGGDDSFEATASVLIRTASFARQQGRWHWRALAGAGITADSDPEAELMETEAKIRALKEALLTGT